MFEQRGSIRYCIWITKSPERSGLNLSERYHRICQHGQFVIQTRIILELDLLWRSSRKRFTFGPKYIARDNHLQPSIVRLCAATSCANGRSCAMINCRVPADGFSRSNPSQLFARCVVPHPAKLAAQSSIVHILDRFIRLPSLP